MDQKLSKERNVNIYNYSPLNWALAFPILKSLPIKAFDYEANPLSIRLLRLLPSQEFTSEIECEIFHATVGESCPPYDALSYTWGDPLLTKPIRLNGKRHHVTVNLELALRYLRGSKERIMWIDAICINQRDLNEKSYQVQRMRSIYLEARVVVIWLGEAATTSLALDFCRQLGSKTMFETEDDVTLNMGIEACFDLFVNRPYWNRMWTVQEVYHDREVVVQVGKLEFDFNELHTHYQNFYLAVLQGKDTEGQVSYERYFRVGSLPQPVIWSRYIIIANRYELGKSRKSRNSWNTTDPGRRPLLDMLQKTRAMESSDPRDKIFALHGLVNEHELIKVDYNSSKKDVYFQTTKQLLEKDATTLEDILLSVESVSTDSDLPSWVPDFSSKQRSIALVMRHWARFFSAADRVGSFAIHEDESLQLLGAEIGLITSVTKTTITDSTIHDQELKRFSLIGFTLNSIFSQFSPPLVRRNRHSSNSMYVNSEPKPFSREKSRAASFSLLSPEKPTISLLGANRGKKNPSFLKTSWGPFDAKVGDIICCLHGCRIPLVLREIFLTTKDIGGWQNTPRFHRLVGACFLIDSKLEAAPNFSTDPGFSLIMRGRVWRNLIPVDEKKTFLLR